MAPQFTHAPVGFIWPLKGLVRVVYSATTDAARRRAELLGLTQVSRRRGYHRHAKGKPIENLKDGVAQMVSITCCRVAYTVGSPAHGANSFHVRTHSRIRSRYWVWCRLWVFGNGARGVGEIIGYPSRKRGDETGSVGGIDYQPRFLVGIGQEAKFSKAASRRYTLRIETKHTELLRFHSPISIAGRPNDALLNRLRQQRGIAGADKMRQRFRALDCGVVISIEMDRNEGLRSGIAGYFRAVG